RARNPDALNVIVPFNAENFTNPRYKHLAQENRNRLRRWSEAAKVAISIYGIENPEDFDELRKKNISNEDIRMVFTEFINLAVIVDNDVRTLRSFPTVEFVAHQ